MSIGDFVNITFTNDEDAPVGNGTELSKATLQPMSDKIEELDNELNSSRVFNFFTLVDYMYMRNQRNIDGFQSSWNYDAGYNSSFSDDTTNFKIGTKSKRLTHTSASEGWNVAYKSISALNVLKSNMGDDFDTSDYVVFEAYISNASAVQLLQIVFSSDAGSNFKYKELSSGFVTGWNYIYFKISELVQYGSGTDLTAVNYISFRWKTNASYNGTYVCGQYLAVQRKHPVYTTRPECFQEFNGAGWQSILDNSVQSDGLLLTDGSGDSYPHPQYIQLDEYTGKNINLGLEEWNCFYAKANFRIKNAGYSPGVRWEKDTNNYLECYLNGTNCYIKKNIAGTPTTESLAIGGTPASDSIMLMFITKVNQIFRCIFWFTSYSVKIIEIVDPFLNDIGKVYMVTPNSTSLGYLRDFVISNKSTIVLNSGSDLW